MVPHSFKEWIMSEARSQKSEMECPHKKDPDFCREWRKFLNHERSTDPILDPEFAHLRKKPALGHSERKGTAAPTRKNAMLRKVMGGKGKYKWKYRGEE